MSTPAAVEQPGCLPQGASRRKSHMESLRDIDAVVLAGGQGTRLRGVVPDRPKPLAEVAGRPFLSYVLDVVAAAGVSRVTLCTGYRAEMVEAAFGGRYCPLSLTYSREARP